MLGFAVFRVVLFQLLDDLLSGILVKLDEVEDAVLRLVIEPGSFGELQ